VVKHVVENLVLEAALRTNVVMKDVVVLMVFGHHGHPGLNAASLVEEENLKEEDHAVKRAVEDFLVQDITWITKFAMINAALSMEDGVHGDPGASVLGNCQIHA